MATTAFTGTLRRRRLRRGVSILESLFAIALGVALATGATQLYRLWLDEKKAQDTVVLIRQILEVADSVVAATPDNGLDGNGTRSLTHVLTSLDITPKRYTYANWFSTPYNPRQTFLSVVVVRGGVAYGGITLPDTRYHLHISGVLPVAACRNLMTRLTNGTLNVEAAVISAGSSQLRIGQQTPASVHSWCQTGSIGTGLNLDVQLGIPIRR